MKLFLIRHAQSLGEVDHKIRSTMPDNRILLTEKGILQAENIGYTLNLLFSDEKYGRNQRMYLDIICSPFERTRQTAKLISDSLISKKIIKRNIQEDIMLSEQQFGLYNGLTSEEIKKIYPIEHEWHQKYIDNQSRFYSPIPMGESRFQVAMRAKLFINDLINKHNFFSPENILIVSHATFIRSLIMVIFNKSPEWFDEEKKPNNCSVRLIDFSYSNPIDQGYIFEGYEQ